MMDIRDYYSIKGDGEVMVESILGQNSSKERDL
jgi:hypothetical protein